MAPQTHGDGVQPTKVAVESQDPQEMGAAAALDFPGNQNKTKTTTDPKEKGKENSSDTETFGAKNSPRHLKNEYEEQAMDLKEQLVIWKKASYLLDNIVLTPKLCEKLVEEEIFTADMMNQVQNNVYNVEKNLKLLTLLGTHGHNVYESFLRALSESDHQHVTKDLRRTFHHTKFGEMLPPSFTYFMDLDEFLRKYPHIAIKLGEEGKHLLHCFIEGKIEVEARKRTEYIDKLKAERDQLLRTIEALKDELLEARRKLMEAEAKIKRMEEKIESLKSKIKELEENNKEQRVEIRRLKHLHKQQADLQTYLKDEMEDFIPKAPKVYMREESKLRAEEKPQLSVQDQVKFDLLQSQVNLQAVKLDLIRASTKHMTHEEKRLNEIKSSLQQAAKQIDRQKSISERQNSNLSRTKSTLSRTTSNLKRSAIRKKSTIIPPKSRKVSTESKMMEETEESKLNKEIREYHAELRKAKKVLDQQFKDGEREFNLKERELKLKEKDLNTICDYKIETYSDLLTRTRFIINNLKRQHSDKQASMSRKHEREIDEFIKRLQEMNWRHVEEVGQLRGRIRQKMVEIYKREMLHKKLKKQITVLCNYQAKNMNATVSVDQCRKIVRGIIGDSRKLRAIIEERELREDEKIEEPDNEKEEKTENKKKAKKKGKKKRKRFHALADERLVYVAERMFLDWRILGEKLQLTGNRLDMIEMDVPDGQMEKFTLKMLQVWRDEEGGKSEQLYTALMEMERSELAVVVIPKKRLENAQTIEVPEFQEGENLELPEIPESKAKRKQSKASKPKRKKKESVARKESVKLPPLAPPT